MEKLTYTNVRGESIVFDGPPFYLVSVNGLGDVAANVQRQKAPYQDGSTRIGSTLEERVIPIEFLIVGDNYHEVSEYRMQMSRILNPKLDEGILRYENGHVIREINVSAESVPFFPDGAGNRITEMQKGLVTLVASDPYWRSTGITEEPAFEPLFEFPFEGEFEMGMQRDQRIIFNDGDAPAPIQVEFFGPALNPKIINNTTGEFIRIKQELFEGERMMIDTSDASVYFIDADGNERNVFPWIDLSGAGTTFFKLEIGENEIEYTADSDIQGTVVNILYSKLYTAV